MKSILNKRTENDILHYIYRMSNDGILQESMLKIGKGTGYSNATVHRSLQTLEDNGYIRIIETSSQRTPNKIQYLGPTDVQMESLMAKARNAAIELQKATESVNNVMGEVEAMLGFIDGRKDFMRLH